MYFGRIVVLNGWTSSGRVARAISHQKVGLQPRQSGRSHPSIADTKLSSKPFPPCQAVHQVVTLLSFWNNRPNTISITIRINHMGTMCQSDLSREIAFWLNCCSQWLTGNFLGEGGTCHQSSEGWLAAMTIWEDCCLVDGRIVNLGVAPLQSARG